MMPFAWTVLYLLCCILAGLAGRDRRIGFVVSLLLSLLVTPVVVLFVIYAFGTSRTNSPGMPET